MTVHFKPVQFGGIRQIYGDDTRELLVNTYSKRGLILRSPWDPESKQVTVLYGQDLVEFARDKLNYEIPADALNISTKELLAEWREGKHDLKDRRKAVEKELDEKVAEAAEAALGSPDSDYFLISELYRWVSDRFNNHDDKDADGNPIFRLRMRRGTFTNVDRE